MRYFILLLITFITGCGAPKYTIAKEDSAEGGSYTLEILKDKVMDIETGVTGKLQYTLQDTPGTSVAVYKYTKTTSGKYKDNFYSEEVVFEFTGTKITAQSIKRDTMLFGVSCYCKGKAGHYKIENPVINQDGENISIKVPEIIDNQQIQSVYIKLM